MGLALVFVAGCHSTPVAREREVCVTRTEAAPGLPRLYRRANASQFNLGPGRLLCDVPAASRPLGDRCEDVDDRAAILGNGVVCGPGGSAPQLVCPRYPAARVQTEAPSITTPPCAAGCPNVQVDVAETSGTVTRIVFYDDPGCHSQADPSCPGAGHPCYYRVLAVSSELR